MFPNHKILPTYKKLKSSKKIKVQKLCNVISVGNMYSSFQTKIDFNNEKVEIYHHPFRHIIINNFLEKNSFDLVYQYIRTRKFKQTDSDLYTFQRGINFFKRNEIIARDIIKIFKYELKEFLMKITEFKLVDKIDISLFKYCQTDMLACHDDVKDTRKIAFILYFVPEDWSSDDGGFLNFYGIDKDIYRPGNIVKSILPKPNKLAMFEVSRRSFHSVSEIISNRIRFSLTGWFHVSQIEIERNLHSPLKNLIYQYFNQYIFNASNNYSIAKTLFEEMAYQLKFIIKDDIFKQLHSEINSEQLKWIYENLPDSHNYESLEYSSIPDNFILAEIISMFSSEIFLKLLPGFDNFEFPKLHPHADVTDEIFIKNKLFWLGSIRRFKHGSFSMVTDSNQEFFGDHIDIFYHIINNEWEPDFGGVISYHENKSGKPIMSIDPSNNSLSVVINLSGVVRIQNYINCRSLITNSEIYQFHLRLPVRLNNDN